VIPENEPLEGLDVHEVVMVSSAVKAGVAACREALSAWLDGSTSQPVERAVGQAASMMLRSVAVSDARPPGPAGTLLVRLLLVALIEEIGRPHLLTPN
jgi:hypothetical protein